MLSGRKSGLKFVVADNFWMILGRKERFSNSCGEIMLEFVDLMP